MATAYVLAERQRREQERAADAVAALMRALFLRVVDPADLDGSFTRLHAAALPVLAQARKRSAALALPFYDDCRAAAGLTPGHPAVVVPGLDVAAATTSLAVTGPVTAKRALGNGLEMPDALDRALRATLGYAARATLAGGRETVIAAAKADPEARGWARVSDGKPCAFCAMLVSRGPVYSEASGAFRAHDKCGCGIRPWFKGDDGWDPDAIALRRIYEDDPTWTPEGGRLAGARPLHPKDFRRAVRDAYADPNSEVLQAAARRRAVTRN